jgi:hypothetical protein
MDTLHISVPYVVSQFAFSYPTEILFSRQPFCGMWVLIQPTLNMGLTLSISSAGLIGQYLSGDFFSRRLRTHLHYMLHFTR